MTAQTLESKPGMIPGKQIIIVLTFILALVLLLVAAPKVENVLNGEHSLAKHGIDAEAIHKCLDSNGPDEVWQFWSEKRQNTFIQGCQLPDGRWGLRIIEKVFYGWRERTSFVPHGGTYQDFIEYVTARARLIR